MSFIPSKKKEEKGKLQRAYCLTAGSVSVERLFIQYPTTLRLHKTEDIPPVCIVDTSLTVTLAEH